MGRGAVSQTPWHPQGVLIAHLAEHRQSVNQLAVAGNGMFFASASNDETVKVWDSRRLEKDVSFKSRLSYTAQGKPFQSSCPLRNLMRGQSSPCNIGQRHAANVWCMFCYGCISCWYWYGLTNSVY